MAVTAIPTNYNGTRFRSRLEAKWAAFFDQCNWRWEYEPNDYDGYIPDFCLYFRVPVLVEVKPLQWDESESDEEILQSVRIKVVHAGIRGEVLALGSRIIPGAHEYLGMMMVVDEAGEVSPWNLAFGFHCLHCKQPSFADETNAWHCRVKGCYDEHNGRGHIDRWDVTAGFRAASSEVQWRPR